jgi:uncharacterized membrane protein YphA (DoxX/SURF4 family)
MNYLFTHLHQWLAQYLGSQPASLLIALVCIAIAFTLIWLGVRQLPTGRGTAFCLVLLRFAIAWHFLFEGVDKLSHDQWTGAPYLREASGPLADEFHNLAGDPVLLYCELNAPPPERDSANVAPNQQLPPALAKDWDNWFDRFASYYDLKGDELNALRLKYEQRKSQMGSWLKGEGKDADKSMTKSAFGVSAEVKQTVPKRVEEYRAGLKKLADLQEKERRDFVSGANSRLPAAKADVVKMRTDLLADVGTRTLDMKKLLRDELPVEKRAQKLMGQLKERFKDLPPEEQAKEIDRTKAELGKDPQDRMRETLVPRWTALAKQMLKDANPEEQKKLNELLAELPKMPAEQLRGLLNTHPAFAPLREKDKEKERNSEQLITETAIRQVEETNAAMQLMMAEFTEEESASTQAAMGPAPVKHEAALKGFLPEPTAPSWRDWSWLKWDRLQWSDFVVRYGLVVVGFCLLLGLFTRTACVAGAGFLLMFFLAMPPLPGLPENPKAEGHYLYINKNIIEMLALLALATTQSGRWVGLDGLLHYFSPFRRRERAAKTEKKETAKPKPSIPRDLGADTPRPDLAPKNGPATLPLADDHPVKAPETPASVSDPIKLAPNDVAPEEATFTMQPKHPED